MKIILGLVIVLAGMIASLVSPAPQTCTDPNANVPIACSLVNR